MEIDLYIDQAEKRILEQDPASPEAKRAKVMQLKITGDSIVEKLRDDVRPILQEAVDRLNYRGYKAAVVGVHWHDTPERDGRFDGPLLALQFSPRLATAEPSCVLAYQANLEDGKIKTTLHTPSLQTEEPLMHYQGILDLTVVVHVEKLLARAFSGEPAPDTAS